VPLEGREPRPGQAPPGAAARNHSGTRIPEPLIAPGALTFLLWNIRCDTTKAQAELGFTPTPLEDGVRRTIEHLRAQGEVSQPS